MAGDLGDLVARLKVDTTSLDRAIAKTHSLGSALTAGFGLAAAAIVGVGVLATDLASKYQSATDLMAAESGITAAQAQRIGAAFLGTAGKVTFSAQTIMAAFAPVSGQLKLAEGHALSAGEALTVMSAAMNLAEATGQPLADTTSALANVMLAYHFSVAQAAVASDILFNVSSRLNIPIATLADSVDKLHYKLGPVAPSLQDVTGLLLDMGAHSGPTGSRGLLLVAAAFNHLLGGSKGVSAELATLKIHLFDANHHFVGMASVIAQLAPKLRGMGDQARWAAENTLLGAGGAKALDATIMAGLPGWDKAATAANKLGTAHTGAATATDNFHGALDRAKAGVTDLLIKIGNDFLPMLTRLADWFTKTVLPALGQFADWFYQKGLPALISFGTWITANLIVPFWHIATVVLPPVIAALVTVFSALSKWGLLVPIIMGIVAAIAIWKTVTLGMWVAQQVTAAVASVQAGITSAKWIASSVASAASWLTTKVAMVAGYVATAASALAQAAIASAKWIASSVASAASWLATKVAMVAGYVATAVVATAQAAIVSAKWIASSVASLASWAATFLALDAGAVSTAIAMAAAFGPIVLIVAGLVAGVTWLIANRATLGVPKGGNWWDIGIKPPGWKPPASDPNFGKPPPHSALGGNVNAGVTRWVGELGPELFTPSVNGTITPNSALGATYHINQTFIGTTGAIDEMRRVVHQENTQLMRLIAAGRRG